MAVVPIYYGSFASVKWTKKNTPKQKISDTDSSSEEESSFESLSTEDAYMFPIFGSVVLFSLYLVFKLLDKEYVNYLVTGYFAFLGVIALTNVGVHIIKNGSGLRLDAYKFVLTKKSKEIYKGTFTVIHLVTLFVSLLLTAYYVVTKNWIASNIFGLAFAFNAIQMLSIDSFKTGMILLSGLFFYDIFWVFGTEVMVTVAKSFDAPIKVVWPKQWFGLLPDETLQFTMLGLGDIVIPGIYVALCLRFDHSLYLKKNPNAKKYSSFPTPYFNTCFTAYILGLITTIVIMHTFKAAQPALLYLSPACILSVLVTGIVKNQLKEVFNYTAEDSEEQKKKKDSVKKMVSSDSEKDDGQTKQKKTRKTEVSDNIDVVGASGGAHTTEEEDYVEVSTSSLSSGKKKKKKSSKKKTG
ncbi:hypothetical protein RclHR1_00760018 [Rhizophagus clarus]|nr:hypothetical protein RclHR1_00760018 [Rhizophagus clarus]